MKDPGHFELDDHTLHVQGLFVQDQAQIRAFVKSLIPDFAAADDVVQETFLEVSKKAHGFERGTNFSAWVRQIARYKILGRIRDFKRRRVAELSEAALNSLIASAPAAASRGDREKRIAALRSCLEQLAPKAREAIRLRYFAEHLPGEIAELLDQSPNAVNVTLTRARSALRNCVATNLERTPSVSS